MRVRLSWSRGLAGVSPGRSSCSGSSSLRLRMAVFSRPGGIRPSVLSCVSNAGRREHEPAAVEGVGFAGLAHVGDREDAGELLLRPHAEAEDGDHGVIGGFDRRGDEHRRAFDPLAEACLAGKGPGGGQLTFQCLVEKQIVGTRRLRADHLRVGRGQDLFVRGDDDVGEVVLRFQERLQVSTARCGRRRESARAEAVACWNLWPAPPVPQWRPGCAGPRRMTWRRTRRSVNQRRSALMSACRTVCRRAASSRAGGFFHTVANPQADEGEDQRAQQRHGPQVLREHPRHPHHEPRRRLVVRGPVPSVVTAPDWFPPRRLSTETGGQAALPSPEIRKPKTEGRPNTEIRKGPEPA